MNVDPELVWYIGIFLFIFLLLGVLRMVMTKYDWWSFTKDEFAVANVPEGGMAHGNDEAYHIARITQKASGHRQDTPENMAIQLFRWMQPVAPYLPATLAEPDVVNREYAILQAFCFVNEMRQQVKDENIQKQIENKFWELFRDATPYTHDISDKMDTYHQAVHTTESNKEQSILVGKKFSSFCHQPGDKRLQHMGSETYERLTHRVKHLFSLKQVVAV